MAQTVRCPWCGAQATVRGNMWECGFCGDSGFLRAERRPKVPITLTVNQTETPPEKLYQKACDCAKKLLPQWGSEQQQLTGCMLLYHASLALARTGSVSGPGKALIDAVCRQSGVCSAAEILHTAREKAPLFEAEGILSDEACGAFWQQLLAALSPYNYGEPYPDALEDLLQCAADAYGCIGEETAALNHRNDLWGAMETQWTAAYPSSAEEQAHAQSRDRLTAQFPEISERFSQQALAAMDDRELLTYFWKNNPPLAVRMWRCLLDGDGVDLNDPDTAERMIAAMDAAWNRRSELAPILDALERDRRFARQLMQCAYVGPPQKDLLLACVSEGRTQLLETLLALLKGSPCPQEDWDCSWEELQGAIEGRKEQLRGRSPKAPLTENGTVYRYCQVRFEGVPRAYSYLSEDESIQPGDRVLAPLGRNNQACAGMVERVDIYTAANAPYPPERTKHILCAANTPVPKPLETPTADTPAAPEQKSEVTAPECETEVIAPPRQPLAPPVAEATPAPSSQEADTPKKSPGRKGWIAVILLLLAIGGARFYLDIRYDEARTNLIAGEFSAAEERFGSIPAFFRDREPLSRYAHAGVLAQSDTLADLDQAAAILQELSESYDGEFSASITARLTDVTGRRDTLLYQQAVDALTAGDGDAAQKLLSRIPDYRDAPALSSYATALSLARAPRSTTMAKALTALERVPVGYAGPLAEEIITLRAALIRKISAAKKAEMASAEALAAAQAAAAADADANRAARQAQSSHPGDDAESGNSLRENYDTPEALYDYGDYDDFDQAWDDWEASE